MGPPAHAHRKTSPRHRYEDEEGGVIGHVFKALIKQHPPNWSVGYRTKQTPEGAHAATNCGAEAKMRIMQRYQNEVVADGASKSVCNTEQLLFQSYPQILRE